MTEQQTLLKEMVDRLFADVAGTRPEPEDAEGVFAGRWAQLAELGIQSLLVPEDAGGFGGGGTEAWLVCHASGHHAMDLPIIEAAIASGLLAKAGLDIPAGVISIASRAHGTLVRNGEAYIFSGVMTGVPWGRMADHVTALIETARGCELICVATAGATVEPCENAAGESRDRLVFDGGQSFSATFEGNAGDMLKLGARARSAQIAGACRAALDMTITHVKDRSQFGKTLSTFQAVQHALASATEQVSAAEAASKAAWESDGGLLEVASAKIVANRAARIVGGIAHQMHGAIGFTWEYDLQHYTRRLIAWQSEFGNSRHWTGVLGALAAEQGADAFWPFLVGDVDMAEFLSEQV